MKLKNVPVVYLFQSDGDDRLRLLPIYAIKCTNVDTFDKSEEVSKEKVTKEFGKTIVITTGHAEFPLKNAYVWTERGDVHVS